MSRPCRRAGGLWTPTEDAVLRREYPRIRRGGSGGIRRLARVLGRSRPAVKIRARRLGLRTNVHWTPRQIAVLRMEWHEVSPRVLREKLGGRTWYAIAQRAHLLGLPFGVPQGCEAIHPAAKRVGVAHETLVRILTAAGVRLHRWYPEPVARRPRTTARRAPRRYAERDEIDAAVAAWLDTEVLPGAARARGVHPQTLRGRMLRLGLATRGEGLSVRRPSEVYDRAMVGYRPRRKGGAS